MDHTVLTRDTAVQACLTMLKAANKQNEELRKAIIHLEKERKEMKKYIKSVDKLGDMVANIAIHMDLLERKWLQTSAAICVVSGATGVTEPNHRVLDLLRRMVNVDQPTTDSPPRSPAAPVADTRVGDLLCEECCCESEA